MITKIALENIIAKQHKALNDYTTGYPREVIESIPYLTDKILLIGGVRGCGCTTLLNRMRHNDYPKAWYTDFDDPRLAGFDALDFQKLDRLMEDSGKGIALFNRIDDTEGWIDFCEKKIGQGIKMVATCSLETLLKIKKDQSAGKLASDIFMLCPLNLFSYNEFLGFTRRTGGEQAVMDFMVRGAFPGIIKTGHTETLHQLYNDIICRDALLAGGIRDHDTLQRVALHLLTSSGTCVTANKLREKLRIKAVSTVTEHMLCLELAGLVRFVSIFSDNPARQAVNPRKVYAVDTALVTALTSSEDTDREKLFETMIFNDLQRRGCTVFYTNEEGGCDFIVTDEEGVIRCIQVCLEDDPDLMRSKLEGLVWALRETGSERGLLVTRNQSDRMEVDGFEIEITDADTFLTHP